MPKLITDPREVERLARRKEENLNVIEGIKLESGWRWGAPRRRRGRW